MKQICLSDLTAVAYLKDPKGKRHHLFGLYSPSRNFHLQAQSAAEARSWVELIRQEARIDEEVHESNLGSPVGHESIAVDYAGLGRSENDRLGSSSPEPLDAAPPRHSTTTRDGVRLPVISRLSVPSFEYSGDEIGPYSDFSDAPSQTMPRHGPFGSFINRKQREIVRHQTPYATPSSHQQTPGTGRNASQHSGFHAEQDRERVIWHGYLLYLKTKGGVRQWKRTWAVLRPKNLAFYKNDEVMKPFFRPATYTDNSLSRNMQLASSYRYQTSLTQWKSIQYQRIKSTACRLLSKKRATAFVHQAKTH